MYKKRNMGLIILILVVFTIIFIAPVNACGPDGPPSIVDEHSGLYYYKSNQYKVNWVTYSYQYAKHEKNKREIKKLNKTIKNAKLTKSKRTTLKNKLSKSKSNYNKIKVISVKTISKTQANTYKKGITEKTIYRTYTEAYVYNKKTKRMEWQEIPKNAAVNFNNYPGGIRNTTSKYSTISIKGYSKDYVIETISKTTGKYNADGTYTGEISTNTSFIVKDLKYPNNKLLLVNRTKIVSNFTYYKNNPYLASSVQCNASNSTIKSLAKDIVKGYASNDFQGKANAIFKWVRNNVSYVSGASYYATEILDNGRDSNGKYSANCYGFSNLIGALCKAVNIPVRFHTIVGFMDYNYPLEDPHIGHAWNELYINGTWKIADGASSANNIGDTSWEIYNSNIIPHLLTNITPIKTFKYFDYIDCNHYLNKSHKDTGLKFLDTMPTTVHSLYFKMSNSPVTSGKQATDILQKLNYEKFWENNGLIVNNTFVKTNMIDPLTGNSIVFWLVHVINITNGGKFSGYFALGENGILYPNLLKLPYYPNGAVI